MKLLVLQPYLNLMGGVDRVILKIAQHYDAKILTLEYNKKTAFPEFSKLDIEVLGNDSPVSKILPYRASQGFRYGYNFYRMKIKEDYDVLNPHISPSEWIRQNNERVLWYCHTPPREVYDLYSVRMQGRSAKDKLIYAAMTKTYKFIASRVIKNIEEIATNSETTNQRIKRYFNRPATVINPGIDYERFMNNGDDNFFFYPSRILVNKRQDYVIEAFKHFSRKSKGRKYRLVIAGTVSKDPEHQAYLKRLKDASKGYDIEIIENISDARLREMYSRSSAVLFAAINEDYGFIPLESMSSSKPIISVNEGGPKETIVDGKTGFLINSPAQMAEKMKFIVEHPAIAERMGREGRRRVEQNYSWELFFEKFDPLLKKAEKAAKE
jgi:glycosyltransferase involved in cell wall biosynthesis